MNYNQFINQKVTSFKGEKGRIISFDQERVVVQINDRQALYKPNVAFKNKALIFDNDKYNHLINNDLVEQDKAKEAYEKKIQKVTKEAIKITKMSSKKFVELRKKDALLKRYFGDDFDYPPFVELKKRFPHARVRSFYEQIKARWNRLSVMYDEYHY